jgi:hypothetical protein
MATGRSATARKMEGDLLKVKTLSYGKVLWPLLLGCCLAFWLAGCAPRIIETPYVPPPPPKPAPPPEVQRPVFYVAATRLNLRGCPGMDCPKISMLEQNEVVEKIGELDDWCEVVVKRDGRRGWVSSRHLATEPVTPAVEAPPPPVAPLPPVVAPPPPVVAPTPPVEKPAPPKPPVPEKPKPVKPGEPPAPPKKKPEEPAKPAKPGEPAPKPAPEKPAPPAVKPAPPEKPAPPKEPEPEQPKKIRIM